MRGERRSYPFDACARCPRAQAAVRSLRETLDTRQLPELQVDCEIICATTASATAKCLGGELGGDVVARSTGTPKRECPQVTGSL